LPEDVSPTIFRPEKQEDVLRKGGRVLKEPGRLSKGIKPDDRSIYSKDPSPNAESATTIR